MHPRFSRILFWSICVVLAAAVVVSYCGFAGASLVTSGVARQDDASLTSAAPLPAAKSAPSRPAVAAAIGKLPLSFERNIGQSGSTADYLARGNGFTVALSATQVEMNLVRATASTATIGRRALGEPPTPPVLEQALLRLTLIGANARARDAAIEQQSGAINYFIGNDPRKWRTDVPHFGKVRYPDVYPGVDLVYYGNQRNLEHDFVVAPGADPRQIRFSLAGHHQAQLNDAGDLIVSLSTGDVRLKKPISYQELAGARREVASEFVLHENGEVSFRLGDYDAAQPLVIDPVLVYSTFLGGNQAEFLHGIAVDASGNIYVTGRTASANFPVAGALTSTLQGNFDVVVTKLNPSGSSLVFSTFIGGSAFDLAYSIHVDSNSEAYVHGQTSSSMFPTTTGAYRTASSGGDDVFLLKLNASGNALVYSTLLGGSSNEGAGAMQVDSTGNAYVSGHTFSSNFPLTAGAFQSIRRGSVDVFVTKVNSTGSALVYSTLLGGNGGEIVNAGGLAVDGSGFAYVRGYTDSADFPVTGGAYDTSFNGGTDTYVVKLNQTGTGLVFSTFFGGPAHDQNGAVAVDAQGQVHISGDTQGGIPITAGAYQTAFAGGGADCYVAKFDPSGSSLLAATYLGGNSADGVNAALAVDAAGNLYVGGYTKSSNFPATGNAVQGTRAGGTTDGFLTVVSPNGDSLLFSSFLGGSGSSDPDDYVLSLALFSNGDVAVVGITSAANFPTMAAFQSTYGGGQYDGFIAKISAVAPVTPPNEPPSADAGFDQIVEATGAAGALVELNGSGSNEPDAGQTLTYEWRDSADNVVGSAAVISLTLPLCSHTLTLTVDDGHSGTASDSVTIVVQDTTPPTLTLTSISYQQILPIATSSIELDVAALSGASATDAVDPAPSITTNAPAQFSAGTTSVTITATDHAGNTAQATFTVTLTTPTQAITQLSNVVQSFNFQQGLSNSLDAKLQNAQDALNAASSSNRADAVNKLQAFINSVNAQRGNQITNAQADQLIAAAQAILAAI